MDAGTAAFPFTKVLHRPRPPRPLPCGSRCSGGGRSSPPRNREMRPAPPCAGLPQGGVAAGIAGKHGHFHPRKPGGQVMAQSLQQGLFGLEHSPDLFVGVQLSTLDLQDGLNMEHRRHRSARRGHPAAFPQILQGVHRDVDAGRIPLRLQNVPDLRRCLSLGQQHLGRCGWTGPA